MDIQKIYDLKKAEKILEKYNILNNDQKNIIDAEIQKEKETE